MTAFLKRCIILAEVNLIWLFFQQSLNDINFGASVNINGDMGSVVVTSSSGGMYDYCGFFLKKIVKVKRFIFCPLRFRLKIGKNFNYTAC